MNISIKAAAMSDADDLTAIQKQAFERLYKIYRDEANPYLRGSDEIRRWLDNDSRDVYAIYADDALCGGIAIIDRGNGEYYLSRLYVSPCFQGKGAGREAIALCEKNYPDAKKWSVDFPEDQIANKKCYEYSGYCDTGLRDVKSDKLSLAIYEKAIDGIFEIRRTQLEAAAEVIRASFAVVAKDFNLTEKKLPQSYEFHHSRKAAESL